MKHQDLNQHQVCWAQYLSRFNFLWLHKLGASMAKANVLSWWEDHTLGTEDNNNGIIIISPDKIGALTVHITNEGDYLIKCIKEAIKTLFMTKKSVDRYEFSDIDTNNLIYMTDGQFYIPDEESLCLNIIRLHYDTPIVSHPRTEKTLELLQHSYF